MTDRELMQQGYEVPLVEQLDAVPRDARLWIENSDGMGSRHFPIGLMCHKAAEALRARLAQPAPDAEEEFYRAWNAGQVRRVSDGKIMGQQREITDDEFVAEAKRRGFFISAPQQREWVGLTDDEIEKLFMWQEWSEDFAEYEPVARAIEAKLREKNGNL